MRKAHYNSATSVCESITQHRRATGDQMFPPLESTEHHPDISRTTEDYDLYQTETGQQHLATSCSVIQSCKACQQPDVSSLQNTFANFHLYQRTTPVARKEIPRFQTKKCQKYSTADFSLFASSISYHVTKFAKFLSHLQMSHSVISQNNLTFLSQTPEVSSSLKLLTIW